MQGKMLGRSITSGRGRGLYLDQVLLRHAYMARFRSSIAYIIRKFGYYLKTINAFGKLLESWYTST
jgi:hypothetical protein